MEFAALFSDLGKSALRFESISHQFFSGEHLMMRPPAQDTLHNFPEEMF